MRFRLCLFLIISFLITGCFNSEENEVLTQKLNSQILKDMGYLSNLEAFYGIDFTNTSKNLIRSNDFYVRVDDVRIFYGYPLDKIEIKVYGSDKKTLYVKLPRPEQISIDRKIAHLKTRREKYSPIDENGTEFDVEKKMLEALNSTLRKYEPKMLEMTQNISKEYFEMIAKNNNMDLKLELEYRE